MKLVLAIAAAAHSVQAFDFFLLSQTWQPAFCSSGNYPGCDSPTAFMQSNLTIHGLWPENQDGSYPSFCDPNNVLSQDTIDAVGMDAINKYWPDVKTNYGTDFISNEWAKHGTCSGLEQVDYINAAIATEKTLGTPSFISNNAGSSVLATALRAAYGSNTVALICKKNVLTEVRSCWSVDGSSGAPAHQIPCPNALLNQETCSRKSGAKISIPAFN
ncbi:hypothetical protein ACHHYP_16525 [Achlya hypogyna]|uniref:Secreted protein n=1 Tax=Achlya hypogyna TaxID=1202772 RepID=A0A0A7CPH9_ACHHY|nr:secreted protein [Achlya hypogyna]OQR81278.1 hypothetical protein ACHHYP_16525 [Achlya hypogyna]